MLCGCKKIQCKGKHAAFSSIDAVIALFYYERMSEFTARSVAIFFSVYSSGEKLARSLRQCCTHVAILSGYSEEISRKFDCIITETGLLNEREIHTILDSSTALVLIEKAVGKMPQAKNAEYSLEQFSNCALLRVLPKNASNSTIKCAVYQLFAKMDSILSSQNTIAAAQSQLRTLLSSLPDIVYVLDEQGYFLYLNESVGLLGYLPSELIGKHFGSIIHPEDRPNISRDLVVEKIRQNNIMPANPPKLFDERRSGSRMTRELEVRLLHKDGHVIYAMVNAYGEQAFDVPLFSDVVGKKLQTIGVIHDISAMHLYQESLEESLAAKERLLREIHHRIKSNLQLVASLAHLKQIDTKAAAAIEVLKDLETQIKSIALVHEALYQSERVDRLSARDFFGQFCHFAEEALERIGSTVHIKVSAEDYPLDPDLLVPLSLVLLYLLEGAYKASYERREKVEVYLSFVQKQNGMQIIEINGEGIFENADSIVMQALLKQANANLEIPRGEYGGNFCRLIVETKSKMRGI